MPFAVAVLELLASVAGALITGLIIGIVIIAVLS